MNKRFNYLSLVLVAIFILSFILLIGTAKKNSQTTDEGIHLYAGYTYLSQNDFRLDPEHPPFLKELSALPLFTMGQLKNPIDGLWDNAGNFYYDSWKEARTLAENFFYSLGNNPDKMLFWGRLPFIILTLILGAFSYFWAKKLYGQPAGVFAAFLILFLPNIIAHGTLINTDLGLTLLGFLGVYFWGEFLKKSTLKKLLIAGIFIGLAFASKFTSIIFIPIILILAIVKLFTDDNFQNWKKYLFGFIGVLFIGFIVIWATYGFSLKTAPIPLGSFSYNIKMWTDYSIPTVFDRLFDTFRPVLVPADFYKGLILVFRHALGGHGAFLLGNNSSSGWWYYFPVAIFFKTPLALFGFLVLAVFYYRKLKSKLLFDELLLIIPAILYLLISMTSKADLGIRHVLPIFPFVIVFASKAANLIKQNKLWLNIIFFILALWYFISSLLSYPNFLSYFNEAGGNAAGRSRILTDSNLDWGQDIYRIKNYVDLHPSNYHLTYPWDGDLALKYYGLDYPLLYPDNIDVTGKVIISATYARTDAYSWLWQYPHENITPGVFVFDLGNRLDE